MQEDKGIKECHLLDMLLMASDFIQRKLKSLDKIMVFHLKQIQFVEMVQGTTQVVGKVTYYGVLRDILVLDYNTFQVPIFKCDWANIVNGVKVDEGFTLVNLHEAQSQFGNNPFILASQAKQLFYSEDIEKSNWYVVLKAPQRGF